MKALRKARGLTQNQLTDNAGLPKVAISKCELHDKVLSIDNLIQAALYFDVSVDYLLCMDRMKDTNCENNRDERKCKCRDRIVLKSDAAVIVEEMLQQGIEVQSRRNLFIRLERGTEDKILMHWRNPTEGTAGKCEISKTLAIRELFSGRRYFNLWNNP